jgi:hypothetical protein
MLKTKRKNFSYTDCDSFGLSALELGRIVECVDAPVCVGVIAGFVFTKLFLFSKVKK